VGRYARILAAQATERFDMRNDRIGSSFEDFLREEGIYEEVEAGAIKKVIACRIEQSMIESRIRSGQENLDQFR